MDPLSDVLSVIEPQRCVCAGFEAGGDWSIRFPRHAGIKVNAVIAGGCWLALEDGSAPVRLEAGDCVLLPTGRPFRLASDLGLAPAEAEAVFGPVRHGRIARCNGGGEFFLVGGYFTLAAPQADLLLGLLPPVLPIRSGPDQAALRWSLDRLRQELREPQPGGALVAQHLAHLMLVHALRQHLADGPTTGWLAALADRQMGAALAALHQDPARRWTVAALARQVGLSRTSFALRFKATVGLSPMAYLTGWRMRLAAARLARPGQPVSAIAASLGYESDSAFSAAFKRAMGCSPREYGRGRGAASECVAAESAVSAVLRPPLSR